MSENEFVHILEYSLVDCHFPGKIALHLIFLTEKFLAEPAEVTRNVFALEPDSGCTEAMESNHLA